MLTENPGPSQLPREVKQGMEAVDEVEISCM